MKPFIAYIVFTSFFLQNIKSQDSLGSRENEKHGLYKARINLYQDQTFKGYITAIKDSSVFLSEKNMAARKRNLGPDPFHKSIFTGDTSLDRKYYTVNKYNYELIESIHIINRKVRTLSLVTGAVAGIIVGTIIGGNHASDQGFGGLSSDIKVAMDVIVGGGVGTLTGLFTANMIEKKYLINGDWKSLEEMKAGLKY
jgi:hypothetical protein